MAEKAVQILLWAPGLCWERQLICSRTALFWNLRDVRWMYQVVPLSVCLLPRFSGSLGCLVLQVSQHHQGAPRHCAHDLCLSSLSVKLCCLRKWLLARGQPPRTEEGREARGARYSPWQRLLEHLAWISCHHEGMSSQESIPGGLHCHAVLILGLL